MENKKIILVIVISTFILFLINSVIAENSSNISQKNVKFDENILKIFNKQLKNMTEGDILVPVIIDIKNFSNIIFSRKDSKSEFNAKIEERTAILGGISDSVLSTLSKDEFQLDGKLISGRGFYGNITKEGFNKLLKDERVNKIYDNSVKGHINLDESAYLINANDAWASGYNGTGQTVCVIDTGVDYTHSYLGGCSEGQFLAGTCSKVIGGYNFVNNNLNPMDDNGHGTNVAGIIASTGPSYKGIANGAKIVALKAADNEGHFSHQDLIDSLSWCFDNYVTYNISIVSMSLGDFPSLFGDCNEDYADYEINELYTAGITLVAASGNEKNPSKLDYPACNNKTISVGATYDEDVGGKSFCTLRVLGICLSTCTDSTTYADKIACFTNRGSSLNLLAPGCEVTSPMLGGGVSYMCGTSQAAPMVSGAAALLLEKKPTLTPSQIKEKLQSTGVSIGSWKRIDVQAALDSICVCGNWTYDDCGCPVGDGGHDYSKKIRTRTCSPSWCNVTSECVPDASCEQATPPETGNCSEAGYESCIQSENGDCNVSIASNLYLNVNNIQWGAVNDEWNPYVISNYTIGWKNKDAKKMYYNCDGNTSCQLGGCNCSQIDNESTMVTVTAPGIAYREGILGYDDTGSNFCWVGWPSFYPNYNDNLIYVLNCFSDSDCSTSQYCNKSGSWDSWNCVNKKSDGQSCTSALQCSSGYCDNDGVGLADDGWCFTPYNTSFDGQETSYCEYSTGHSIGDCDERQAGTSLNKCVGVSFYEDKCSDTCQYQDITSVFDCSGSGCSCSQPLCDGLTSGSNVTTCSSGETYFADNCTSAADGQDRDNICRSSSFASDCTADPECDGIVAGTGNCNAMCELIPDDTYKFYIKNSTGNTVAWMGNLGNLVLKGSCFAGTSCNNPGSNSFIIKNASNINVAFINSTGDLCIVKGNCSDKSASCNPTTKAFVMKNSSGYNMSYIDLDGDLCLTGRLYENSIYV